MRARDLLTDAGLVHAAVEPGRELDPAKLGWLKFATSLANALPERFKLSKHDVDHSLNIEDSKGWFGFNKFADSVSMRATIYAPVTGDIQLFFKDSKSLDRALAYVKLQDAAFRVRQAALEAMTAPMAEVMALLPVVASRGKKVDNAVKTLRRRVNEAFDGAGGFDMGDVL